MTNDGRSTIEDSPNFNRSASSKNGIGKTGMVVIGAIVVICISAYLFKKKK
jgi:hypothetical protein